MLTGRTGWLLQASSVALALSLLAACGGSDTPTAPGLTIPARAAAAATASADAGGRSSHEGGGRFFHESAAVVEPFGTLALPAGADGALTGRGDADGSRSEGAADPPAAGTGTVAGAGTSARASADPELGAMTALPSSDPVGAAAAGTVQFEARVRAASPARELMRLAGGTTVIVNADTNWSPRGDLFDLGAVAAALASGSRVRVEGRGTSEQDGTLRALRVKVEVDGDEADDDDDDNEEAAEFDAPVRAADAAVQTLRLAGGVAVSVTEGTTWSPRGDLFSIAQVAAALADGARVRVEGRGDRQADGSIVARRIKAEADAPGDDSDDDSDDDEADEVEFEAGVRSVEPGAETLRLVDGTTILADASTKWAARGDLFGLAAVADALAAGMKVRVKGRGEAIADGTIRASRIKAEVDDDGDDDGDDDSDDSDDDSDDDDGDDDGSGAVTVEVRPDEWRTEWATGSNSGSGGDAIELRFKGSGFDEIRGDTVRLTGPGGELAPLSTRLHDDSFRAEFSKRDAIGLLGDDVRDGERVTLTVRAELDDGSLVELAFTVKVRADD